MSHPFELTQIELLNLVNNMFLSAKLKCKVDQWFSSTLNSFCQSREETMTMQKYMLSCTPAKP